MGGLSLYRNDSLESSNIVNERFMASSRIDNPINRYHYWIQQSEEDVLTPDAQSNCVSLEKENISINDFIPQNIFPKLTNTI